MTEGMSAAEFQRKYGNGNPTPSQLQNSKSKRHEAQPSVQAICGKVGGLGIPHVCFTLCRVRLLDVDAKYASIKDLLDGLQHAGLICGDKEGEITLEVNQEKVSHFHEEKTIIDISL